MKQTNLSKAGILLGLVIAISSWYRYFVMFPDPDKALFFGLIGLLCIAISWNYAGRIMLRDKIEHIENTLTDLEQYVVDKELNIMEVK